MKAVMTQGFGLYSKLVVKATTRPTIRSNEVLVEVHASSVNPKDWKLNLPIYSLTPKFLKISKSMIFGDDLAGVIVEVGNKVTGFKVGDSVYGMSMHFRTGSCAEFAAIPQQCISLKPKNLGYSEAASAPLAGLTALQGLNMAGVGKDSKVLIIGASGGVGSFAVQIAKAMGAHVSGVCSGKNIELVAQLGADDVIDYTTRDYINEENNFDVVIDATSFQSLFSCSSLLKDDGVFVTTVGYANAFFKFILSKYRPGKQIAKNTQVKANPRDLEALTQYIEQGHVTPLIDGQYSLNEIGQSYARSRSGRAVGKIVINIK